MRYYKAGNLTSLWFEVFGDVTSRLYTLEYEKKQLIRIKIANLIRLVFSFRAMFAGLLQADKFKLSPVGTSKNVIFWGAAIIE